MANSWLVVQEAAAELKKTLEKEFKNVTNDNMPDGFKVVCYKVWYFEDSADSSEKESAVREILQECKDEVRGNVYPTGYLNSR